ncbi:hypothetical protein HNQ94_001531 [Salirhabdus euzebyi]|uniref:DZANK-type domain-containing protein n=1 Tax=Salirhabdus euzebyi TaxID=394506 RepID=A0A841Q3Y9_9BACI|nr:zinc ribbon domain-containing protein [Salirhabdus euzebyi]MBB6453083.1 hypothetical protein [Salirhabdus euzebyi]
MIYCNQCGTANNDSAMYCTHDGHPLKSVTLEGSVSVKESKFCGQCGQQNIPGSIYCRHCGLSLEKVSAESKAVNKTSVQTSTRSTGNFQVGHLLGNFQNMQLFKTALTGVIISILIVLMGSFILSKISEDNALESLSALGVESPTAIYEEFFYQAGPYIDYEDMERVEKKLNPYSTVNMVMLSNFVNQDFVLQSKSYPDEGIDLNVNLGLMFYVFLPILALFLAGVYVKSAFPNISITNKASISVYIGLLYGLFLGVLSFFAGFSFNFSAFEDSIRFANDYSFIHAVFNGVVLGSVFSFLGSFKKEDVRSQFSYGDYVKKGATTFLLVFAVVGLITSVATYFIVSNNMFTKFLFENVPFVELLVVLFQFSIYVLNITMFNTFKIQASGEGGMGGELKFSLFGPSGDFEAHRTFGFLDDKMIYLFLLAIITAAIFVWVGKKLASGDLLRNVLIFSVIFAVIFTFFTANVSIYVEGLMDYERGKIFAGFSLIQTFIVSLIYSGILSFIGAKFLGEKNS